MPKDRTHETLQRMVDLNLNLEVSTGNRDLLSWTPREIAVELMAYSEDVQELHIEDLVPYIQNWLDRNKNAKG